jgi:hypothetical protein
VREAAVTGEPDDDLGERIVAWVVAEGDGAGAKELIDHVAAELAPAQAPARVRFLDELPRNAMGKVVKARPGLRAGYLRSGLTTSLTLSETPPTASLTLPSPRSTLPSFLRLWSPVRLARGLLGAALQVVLRAVDMRVPPASGSVRC